MIVGKRALPALALAARAASCGAARAVAEPDDIVIALRRRRGGRGAVRAPRRGCLTIAFAPVGAEWELVPPTDDPFVAQELAETAYHVLWELVHVFFDHRGLLEGRERAVHDAGASSFLYPFLGEREDRPRGGVRRRARARC